MKDGEPVWFGCDVGKRSTRESGVMDTKIFALEDLFQTDFPMTKAQRLDYGQSLMTHAMVFQGVNIDENGQPNRWRVENSWGPDAGRDGYYTMTDRWFDEYTYQIVVNRKYLPKEVLEAYEQEPIVLKPWDRWDLWHRGKRKSRFFQEKILPGAKASVREKSVFGEKSPGGAFFVAERRSF